MALLCCGLKSTRAGEIESREPWTIIPPLGLIENDSLFGIADRHYTNGLYASATSGGREDCGWCESFAKAVMPSAKGDTPVYRYGFFAGQSMFTPEDLSLAFPDPEDRPYGGWLFIGGRLYRQAGNVLDRAQVTVGVVGPGSGADAIQRWWHALHWFGGVPPEGWHSQIKDEPGFVLTEQRLWRVPLVASSIDAELLPEANVSIGNIFTYAGVGATFRIGRHLNADWGPPRIEPALEGSDFVDFKRFDGVAWYVFAGIEGRAVARNIFLDGNTFQHSANIAKEPFVGDLDLGAGIVWRVVRLNATYVVRTNEFKTQHGDDKFFSFSLSFAY